MTTATTPWSVPDATGNAFLIATRVDPATGPSAGHTTTDWVLDRIAAIQAAREVHDLTGAFMLCQRLDDLAFYKPEPTDSIEVTWEGQSLVVLHVVTHRTNGGSWSDRPAGSQITEHEWWAVPVVASASTSTGITTTTQEPTQMLDTLSAEAGSFGDMEIVEMIDREIARRCGDLCDSDTAEVIGPATAEQAAASDAAGHDGNIAIDTTGRVVSLREAGRRAYVA